MATLTVERDITKPVSAREQEEADLLMAAMLDGEVAEVTRMLIENRYLRAMIKRGALRLLSDVRF